IALLLGGKKVTAAITKPNPPITLHHKVILAEYFMHLIIILSAIRTLHISLFVIGYSCIGYSELIPKVSPVDQSSCKRLVKPIPKIIHTVKAVIFGKYNRIHMSNW